MDDRWHEDLQEQVRQEACERGTAGRITVSQQQVLHLRYILQHLLQILSRLLPVTEYHQQ